MLALTQTPSRLKKLAISLSFELITQIHSSHWFTDDKISKDEVKRLFVYLLFTMSLDVPNSKVISDIEFTKTNFIYDVCKQITDRRPLTDSAHACHLSSILPSFSSFSPWSLILQTSFFSSQLLQIKITQQIHSECDLLALLNSFRNIVSLTDETLGLISVIQHAIHLSPGFKSSCTQSYRVPHSRQTVDRIRTRALGDPSDPKASMVPLYYFVSGDASDLPKLHIQYL
ncbi:hypothetical protein E2C01_031054 [Portunus trituberculatus]|uniref:Uncharacterized protein n=1 Tax=Portunus trituberculatus TaxID=210409 RepID=A0A5B7EX27_PORTR|nr:hypothetical protein [Portunus trituberculatus]